MTNIKQKLLMIKMKDNFLASLLVMYNENDIIEV